MTAPLNPEHDPDRFDPDRDPAAGRGDTLPELLGAGAYDDTTNPYMFLLGLLGVIVFLGLVALLFSNLSP